ncbi:hypothetical protein [Aquitalea sp. LB_tupeE]|uniref:hypothetical protein n=1 Tax=Aquitalea sp. LB_tupeE TaxID=2748078 RepID=UPI0015BC6AA5|nr:hypothetical protein [Aquitalea sp. LB_tupeE]NWK78371.1 hypothetical protein [Aquitalea sp. LB_tupeE]
MMSRCLWISLLFACIALLSGCSTMATSIAAKGSGTARVYAASTEQVWAVLPGVVRASGLDYVNGDKQQGMALAQRGMSALSYGENVAIFVSPEPSQSKTSQTRVEVVSKRTFAPNILATNWESVLLDGLATALAGRMTDTAAVAASTPSSPLQHRDKVPAPSAYASIDDTQAIPYIGDKGRARYPVYLKAATPKAFVINQRGGWRWIANDSDAMRKTLSICLADPGAKCWLYAVDNQVVWQEDESKRISLPELLLH